MTFVVYLSGCETRLELRYVRYACHATLRG